MNGPVIDAAFGEVDAMALLGLDAAPWENVAQTSVSLEPTSLDRQPSAYIQASWESRQRGDVAQVHVKAVRTTDHLALQLTWTQPEPARTISDYNGYADACAVLFPDNGEEAELTTMGSERLPVAGWYWRAGAAEAFEIMAHGVGTVERSAHHQVRCAARWSDDHWHVVLMRSLDLSHPNLSGVIEVPVAFAVWCGHRAERAGLKSISPAFGRLRMSGGSA